MLFHKVHSITMAVFMGFFILFLSSGSAFAQQKYGIIIINDSANPSINRLCQQLEKYVIYLRDFNEENGGIAPEILWIKPYDYSNPTHADFIRQVIGVPRSSTPYAGLSLLHGDTALDKFIPGTDLPKFNNARLTAQKLMEQFRSYIPQEKHANYLSTITGFGEIKSEPSGAAVVINDKEVGKTPLTDVFLPPGEYSVSIKKEKFTEFISTEILKPGDYSEITAILEQAPGRLAIETTPPGAAIKVNGEPHPSVSSASLELSPGSYTISLTREGYKDYQFDIEIQSEEEITRTVRLEADKVKCSLEVKGYYARVRIRTGPRTTIEKTFAIDPELLSRKVRDYLSQQELVDLVPLNAQSEIHILFEAKPEEPLSGTIKVTDRKSGKVLLNAEATGERPMSASDEDLVNISLKVFQEKLMPKINETLLKYRN